MVELQLINELSESRLFRSIDKYQEYTLQDVAELTYIYVLILELFRTTNHKDFAQKYVKNTIRFNNFHSFKFSANDLYHFSHLLVGENNERSVGRLKDTSHKTRVDFLHYRRFLRDIAAGRFDKAFDKRYLLRLEKELGIRNSNLKAIRRMVTNWIVLNDASMKKSAATKLLLELRKRALKSELRMELEKFGRIDEYKMIKVEPIRFDDTTINVYKNPTKQEFMVLLNKTSKKHPNYVGKDIRGLIDSNGYLYVWDAFLAYHEEIKDALGMNDVYDHIEFILTSDGKLNFYSWLRSTEDDIKHSKFVKKILEDKLDEYKLIKTDITNSFKNPSHKEMKMLLKKHTELKGLTDSNDNLYVWDAFIGIHHFMSQALGLHEYFNASFFGLEKHLLDTNINGIYYYNNSDSKNVKDSKSLQRALGIDKLNEYKMIKVGQGRLPDTLVFKNLMRSEFLALLKKHQELRGLIDQFDNLYIWDAYNAEHYEMAQELGKISNVSFINSLFFSEKWIDNEWNLKEFNNVWLGTLNKKDLWKYKNLTRIMGWKKKDKLKEYKVMKIPNKWDNETIIYIFKNPTHKELLALLKKIPGSEFRGSVDQNQNLYIWNAYDASHDDIEQSIGFKLWTDLYFALEKPNNEWRNSTKINGIFVGFLHNKDFVIAKSKFVKKVLGLDKLKEYKIMKITPRFDASLKSTINVYKNPTKKEFMAIINKSKRKDVRGLVDRNGYLYIWDAFFAYHEDVKTQLDITTYDHVEFVLMDNNINFYSLMRDTKDVINYSKFVKKVLEDKLNELKIKRGSMQPTYKNLTKIMGCEKKDRLKEYKMIKTLRTNVFKNPTRSEFLSLLNKAGELRGLVDTNENLYVWNASDAIHQHITDDLVDITFYDQVFFSYEFDFWDEWDLKYINKVFFGSHGQNLKRTRKAVNNSKFLRKVLGLNKLNEYKLIKIKRGSMQPTYIIYQNPTPREVEQLLIRWKELRGAVDLNGNIFVWKAYDSTHLDTQIDLNKIGLPGINDSPYKTDWDFDFVFSTADMIDDNDWSDLKKFGNYFYGENKKTEYNNKFLIRILNYLKRKSSLNEYSLMKLPIQSSLKQDTLHLLKNPNRQDFLGFLSRHKEVRGLVDDKENVFIWPAGLATHSIVMKGFMRRDFRNFYDSVFFKKSQGENFPEWDDKMSEINGVLFNSQSQKLKRTKLAVENSPFLRKMLGIK